MADGTVAPIAARGLPRPDDPGAGAPLSMARANAIDSAEVAM